MSKRYRQVAGFSCLAALLGGFIVLGARLIRVRAAVSTVRADLVALESLAARPLDVGEAVELLHTTRSDLEALQDTARPFLWLAPRLGWLPCYGPDIQAAPLLLGIALDLITAGEQAVEPLLPLLDRAEGEPGGSGLLEVAAINLEAARPNLMAVLSMIQEAQVAREGLETERLSPRMQEWVERLDRYLPLLEQGMEGLLLAPELLGAGGPRVYLVLIQNNDELRATGGFISGVAQVTVEEGRVLGLAFEDSYAVDDFSKPYPEPPAALRETMLADLWLFRDSNWSPDFPTSARAAIDLYTISRDVDADGVVALDQEAICLLVGALGQLQIEGYPEPVTGENVIQMAQQAWEPGEEAAADWWVHRKDFMAALLEAVVRRVEGGLNQGDLVRLAHAVLEALDQRHLLLYLADEEAAALLVERGWDGALIESAGDYLMVVDSNVGFNKANALVEESLEYVVDLTDLADPQATLAIRHHHPLEGGENPCRQEPRYSATYEEMTQRCYWDFVRVYVPSGAQLLDAIPHSISGEELLSGLNSPGAVAVESSERGREVFGTFLLLRPGEDLETRFEYALPRSILQAQGEETKYALVVQKQPGTDAAPLHVFLLLPPGVEIESSEPEPSLVNETGVGYTLTLERDRVLEVVLRFLP